MALKLARKLLVNPCFISTTSFQLLPGSSSNHDIRVFLREDFQVSYLHCKPRFLCSIMCQERLSWEGSSHAVLLTKIENALKELKLDEAWESFHAFKRLYGFPSHLVVTQFITQLSYSTSPHWLQKACELVMIVLKDKSFHLQPDVLAKLVLSLARAKMPIQSSMILRLMLEKETLPPMNILWLVFMHLVKSETGTCVGSNLLIQICECYIRSCSEKSRCRNLLKPDTMIFNLMLDACVRFGSSIKGQQIIELMSQIGVVADAHSINIMAQIHELNAQRDELKKFKDHIAPLPVHFVSHYQQFYECLLSLHFKFNDMDAAAELVLGMNSSRESHPIEESMKDYQKSRFVPIGSPNLRNGLKIQIVPELLQKDFAFEVEGKLDLIMCRDKKLFPSNRAVAKFINAYKRQGRITELSKFLLSLTKELYSSDGSNLISDVIDACITLGWLEIAHDILEDMEFSRELLGSSTYMALLTAYQQRNMSRERNVLLKQMKKAGLLLRLSGETVNSENVPENVGRNSHCINEYSICQPSLSESLAQEINEAEKTVFPIIYELNSSIYFFSKAKMMEDALKIYRSMQQMKIQPTELTFSYLVCGYSSLQMYRDITILWGDVKRTMASGNLSVNSDLYEIFLLNFLRGGYFERVMEVIGYMNKCSIFIDKWMYKNEYLKIHKNLYRGLRASKARTEVQGKRVEQVKAFKKWVGID